MTATGGKPHFLCTLFFFFCHLSSSQKTCPDCGSMKIPYPLSTAPSCGDADYRLRCNSSEKKLYLDALNQSSYLVLSIQPASHHLILQPSPWIPATCTTRDFAISEGLWLNQSLPFNITSANTVFLFDCSPRLLISPLNCTASSLCHRYLDASRRVSPERAGQCSDAITPCCTFVSGGMPSGYKIRLHSSGCRAFRSILHLDPEKPPSEWEEGLEIQWRPPPEPACTTESDCSPTSSCSHTESGVSRCLCNKGYYWDPSLSACSKTRRHSAAGIRRATRIALPALAFIMLCMAVSAAVIRSKGRRHQSKLERLREEKLRATTGGKPARLFGLKEIKKATDGFSKERVLGSGGFGKVYSGILPDGTPVAVKAAKVGDVKSNDQVLNEVGILSQVNHKHLVKLLGCCVEGEQPLLVYEYVPNGTLHDHLHRGRREELGWRSRVGIALQTAEALAYLHSSAHTPIYHRDVKSTNILLDEKLNAKVADFGLSRLAAPGLSHVSTCAQGTLGYLDPEYYKNYQLTDKSDVYSFGVVLLELLTGEKAIDFSRAEDDVNLALYVTRRVERGGGAADVADRRLVEDEAWMRRTAGLVLEVALTCLREKRGERPGMREIVLQLQNILEDF